MNIDEIKTLLKSGDVAGAGAAAQELLAAEPDNAAAQMLYGTCRHLLGDDKTFGEIHDKLAPKMATEGNEKTLSLWRRYHKLWMALIAGGLVAVTGGALYFAEDVANLFEDANVAACNAPARIDSKIRTDCRYAAPPNRGLRFFHEQDSNTCR